MDIEKILLDEKISLRIEMKHLKMCQLRYFMLSITVAGVIFGVGSRLQEISNIIYLSPLIVIFPCWWVFLDKAKTISRIVGYYRVLESMVIEKGSYEYRGWENSLSTFRVYQEKGFNDQYKLSNEKLRSDWQYYANHIFLLKMPHKYWVINWYTYFIISLISIALSMLNNDSDITTLSASILALCFFAGTVFFTGKSLLELIYGGNSYSVNEKIWKEVLKPKLD